MARRINNAVVIKTINGKGTLKERTVQFPEPRSNQALICAQNSVDGTVCRKMLVLAM
jgi:hypothetical protein